VYDEVLFVVAATFAQITYSLNMESRFLTSQCGPFKYDVYVGFGVCDLVKLNLLREKLEQRNVLCYPKYDAAVCQKSVKSAIVEGVARSRKCLLYVSKSFIEDAWYKFEVAEVLNKAKRFSRDMLVVLKDPQLADTDMPPELKDYVSISCTLHDDSTLESQLFLHKLATTLMTGTCLCITERLYMLYFQNFALLKL